METNNTVLRGDKYIWGIYILLCVISIIEIYSASSTLTYKIEDYSMPAMRHFRILMMGSGIVLLLHRMPAQLFRIVPFILWPITMLLLMYVLFFGDDVNNAQRSAYGIQPSEWAKLAIISATAFLLSFKQPKDGILSSTFKKILWISVPPCLLIFPENFSTALMLAAVVFCMMLIGMVEWRKLLGSLAVVIAFVGILIVGVPWASQLVNGENHTGQSTSHVGKVLTRLDTWIGRIDRFVEDDIPEYQKKTGEKNYQVHHAHMAIANGGLIGQFPGNSRERDFLPQAYSDFIYAIIIEEMGFLGGLFVIILYLFLLLRTAIIARKCMHVHQKPTYTTYLIIGLSLLIVLQALINMGVAVGGFPVTGQPLPLISRGGNSTIVISICFGIILSVSNQTDEDARKLKESEEVENETEQPVTAQTNNKPT